MTVENPEREFAVELDPDTSTPVASGVAERMTYRAQLDLRSWPSVEALREAAGWRTATAREWNYFLLRSLDLFRRRLGPHYFSTSEHRAWAPLRTAYRALRGAFTRHLLTPYLGDLRRVETPGWSSYGFETYRLELSRRVFSFDPGEAEAQLSELVCHVLSLSPSGPAAVEHLLTRFAAATARQELELPILEYDPRAELALWVQPSLQVRGRSYCEVLILPDDAMAEAVHNWPTEKLHEFDVRLALQHQMGHEPEHATTDSTADRCSEAASRSEAESLAMDPISRAKRDWELIMGELDRASSNGRAIDDDLVNALAMKRLRRVQRHATPAASFEPTFESSVAIVRDIVALHRLDRGLVSTADDS